MSEEAESLETWEFYIQGQIHCRREQQKEFPTINQKFENPVPTVVYDFIV
jgi:hypothetical protein